VWPIEGTYCRGRLGARSVGVGGCLSYFVDADGTASCTIIRANGSVSDVGVVPRGTRSTKTTSNETNLSTFRLKSIAKIERQLRETRKITTSAKSRRRQRNSGRKYNFIITPLSMHDEVDMKIGNALLEVPDTAQTSDVPNSK